LNTRQTARDWLTVGTRTIDQASIDAFRRDGAVVLREIFSDWTDRLRQGVAQVMADPSPLERSYHTPGSAPFFQDLCNWQRISSFKDFVLHSPFFPPVGSAKGRCSLTAVEKDHRPLRT
jgi:ectoine hydroxylase-related dioxygenase (phytanoyl-CoA dioxygenase family)